MSEPKHLHANPEPVSQLSVDPTVKSQKAPPLQLQASSEQKAPMQLSKEPRSVKECIRIDNLPDDKLQEEIDLLQKWIEDNPTHANLHYYITLITTFRDTLAERKGIKSNPEEVTKSDYNKMYKENNTYGDKGGGKKGWKAKSISHRKKNIKKLTSPTGHQAGEGGWLESNKDNNALFDAYFSSVLPSGITVDDLKILSSDFSTHNPGYKELPPPDLWPAMRQSLELIKRIQDVSGLTWQVASAYRSFRVNAHAGGSKGSQHMKFLGLDLLPQGDKKKNESFLKYFYLTAGKKENMGFGFYSTSRQHIDGSGHRNWKWGGDSKKSKGHWRKKFVKDWGEEKAKKLENW